MYKNEKTVRIAYELNAALYRPFEGSYSMTIDENGDCTDFTTHDGFDSFEDAMSALEQVKKKNYSNFKSFYITKNTAVTTFDEDGIEAEDGFNLIVETVFSDQ